MASWMMKNMKRTNMITWIERAHSAVIVPARPNNNNKSQVTIHDHQHADQMESIS
jgi:hypothetical protein